MKKYVARTTPWGTIQTGELFDLLPKYEQDAILAHERGHIVHKHAWKRIKWILTLRAFRDVDGFLEMCIAQELEADAYAKMTGHEVGLISFLSKRKMSGPGYPNLAVRIRHLCE